MIFLSYRRSDSTDVDALAEALTRVGVPVWLDRDEIDAAAAIQERIDTGLARCHALLAWFSLDYPRSRACQWEITAALVAARAESAGVHRVFVINPAGSDSHLQPLALRNIQHIPAPARGADGRLDSASLDRIAAQIAAALRPIPGPLGALRRLARPPCRGFTPLGSNRFVGRVGDLWQIHDALVRGDFAIVAGQPNPTAAGQLAQVQGSGGIGKSLLAEEYALRFGAFWPGGIFWLRAMGNPDQPDTPDQPAESADIRARRRAEEYSRQMAGFAADLGLDPKGLDDIQLRRALAQRLETAGQPYLWIVDDLPDSTRRELDAWLAPGPLGQTLVTTRSRRHGGVGFLLALDLLPPADARDLLIRDHPPGPADEAAVAAILARLDGHALALDIARAACRRQGYTRFLALLENPGADALELAAQLADELPSGHTPSIAATFLAGFADLPAEGQDFLRLAAQLATAPIEHGLVALSFAIADETPLEAAAPRADLGMQQAIDRSLAEDLGAGTQSAGVHALVSRTLRFHDSDPARQAALRQAAIETMGTAMAAGKDIRNHDWLEQAARHAAHLAVRPGTEAELRLAAHIGRYEFEAARYAAGRDWLDTAQQGLARLLGAEHPTTLTVMNNLAETLRAQGDLASALELQKSVLAILRRVQGEEHPDTLTVMNNLANILQVQGDLTSALDLQKSALATLHRVLGEEHPNTLASMSNLAETFRVRGDLAGALDLHKAVLATRRQVLGEEHPDTLTSMNNLALTLHAQGDLAGALNLHKAELAICRRVLGEEHPDTLASMGNLASTLQDLGNLAGALDLQKSALATRYRVLGAEHPDTFGSAWNLFTSVLQLDDRVAAQELLRTHLFPLLARDPASLAANLQSIRRQLLDNRDDIERHTGLTLPPLPASEPPP